MKEIGTSRKWAYCLPVISGRSGFVTKSGMPRITAQTVRWMIHPAYFDCEAVIWTNIRKTTK